MINANVYVTAKGAAMQTNNWKEGQEITCSEPVAKMFIAKGIASEFPVEENIPGDETKTQSTNNQTKKKKSNEKN